MLSLGWWFRLRGLLLGELGHAEGEGVSSVLPVAGSAGAVGSTGGGGSSLPGAGRMGAGRMVLSLAPAGGLLLWHFPLLGLLWQLVLAAGGSPDWR